MPKLVTDHLLTKIPTFAPDTKVREVVAHLTDKKHEFESISYVYVVDIPSPQPSPQRGEGVIRKSPLPLGEGQGEGILKGVVSVKELLRTSADTEISKIMKRELVTTHPGATLERAAITAIQHGIKAVPVVDHDGTFVGVVGTDTILHTLHKEHVEDLLRLGGIQIVEQKHILEMLTDRVMHLLRIRTPWLLLGLVGGFFATFIVSLFEQALSNTVALAFFIPVIVYMSDAVGTQAQTLFIRALAVKNISVGRYAIKELLVDCMLGLVLGALVAAFGLLWSKGGGVIPAIVGLAMAINVVVAGTVAILISWLLHATRRDPALGAGPFATVIQDILSLVVYFAVASVLL